MRQKQHKLTPHSKITVHHAIQAMVRAGISDPSQYLMAPETYQDIKKARLTRPDVKKIKKWLFKDGRVGVQFQGIGAGAALKIRLFHINGDGAHKIGRSTQRPGWISPFARPEVIAKAVATRRRNKALQRAGLTDLRA